MQKTAVAINLDLPHYHDQYLVPKLELEFPIPIKIVRSDDQKVFNFEELNTRLHLIRIKHAIVKNNNNCAYIDYSNLISFKQHVNKGTNGKFKLKWLHNE
jgi:hypothetical protein